MAKKKKNNMFANVMSAVTANMSADTILQNATEIKDIAVESKFDKPEEIKFDDTCTLADEVLRLSKENSILTDKIASYIDEVNSLKDQLSAMSEANDRHVMKIADLSFELASVKAQLVSGKNNDLEVNSRANRAPIEVRLSTTVPYTINRNNGYSDWN